MQLYTFDPAPNPRRLALFLAYKGIELPTTQVDLMKGEQLGESYRAINPAGTVPALVLDDGTVMSEVIGICDYLEALYPEKPLFGDGPLARAQVLAWDHHLFVGLYMAIAETLRNGNPAFEDRALPGPFKVTQIPALCERGRQRLAQSWPALDKTLAGRDFLVGSGVTLADIDLLVAVEFAGWIKESVPESCTHLHGWLARTRETLGIQG
jgi:glutathione S-transferase